jgi:hypothetical protein
MEQALIVIAGFLASNVIAFTVYHIKEHNKEDKIEIMSVRSELKKIDKINKESKESMF